MDITQRADLQRAAGLLADACRVSRQHASASSAALSTYGAHGPDVSGVVRAHFPDATKDRLRSLAREVGALCDAAYNARPPRVHHRTMRDLAQAIAARDGSGFYGPQP